MSPGRGIRLSLQVYLDYLFLFFCNLYILFIQFFDTVGWHPNSNSLAPKKKSKHSSLGDFRSTPE